MTTMGNICVLDSEDRVVADKPKPDKKTNVPLARKKLADISNMSQRPDSSAQDEIEWLKKENKALVKLLADRNKLIELSGLELQKLRVNLQKMQLQNMQLAQSNSQIVAELNSGKDTLKALHHELGCKNGLIQALRSELEVNVKSKTRRKVDKKEEVPKPVESEQPSEVDRENKLPCHTNRRQRSTSLVPSTTVKQAQDKEKAENKRPCVRRRQSARFRCEEQMPAGTDVNDQIRGDGSSTSMSLAVNQEGNSSLSGEAREFERLYIGRPSRQAAKKVHSYKEISINVKMRRTT
ncbi:hypothetical protein LguiA_016756 [Lonicera macranthoides]